MLVGLFVRARSWASWPSQASSPLPARLRGLLTVGAWQLKTLSQVWLAPAVPHTPRFTPVSSHPSVHCCHGVNSSSLFKREISISEGIKWPFAFPSLDRWKRTLAKDLIESLWGVTLKLHIWVMHECSVAKSCPTLCDPWTDCSPPGSFIHGVFQTKILKWVAISRGSAHPRGRIRVSCIGKQVLYLCLQGTHILVIEKHRK